MEVLTKFAIRFGQLGGAMASGVESRPAPNRADPSDSKRRTCAARSNPYASGWEPNGAVSTIEAHSAAVHARRLLAWLQGPGGRTGTIPAAELAAIHVEMCATLDWEQRGWVAVGRELRRLTGTGKEYTRCGGRKTCIYRIPPAVTSLRTRRAA